MTGSESIDTADTADSALEAVNTAITNLNSYRANVGAAQNRLDFASDNLSIAIENAEAARSTLLDLDIASEMTNFTSKQVLLQSGVAMLAQANQLPATLLRLLQ
jgi:flagellin